MLKLAVLMDPIDAINVRYDTSLRLLREADQRNWQTFYLEPKDLFIKEGTVFACIKPIKVFSGTEKYFEFGEEKILPLSFFDVLLMRKDPPFNIDYVYLTYLLEIASSQGCKVINHPRALRDANEKIFASWFVDLIVPTLITQRKDLFLGFLKEHQRIVLKPLDLMGGRSIYLINHGETSGIDHFNELSAHEQRLVLVQPYLPEVSTLGDKRIFLINGIPYEDVLLRKPKAGDFKANMAAGGSISLTQLTPRDHEICTRIGPVLKKMGILFAGIDVIGNYLTEINITSPTGIPALESLTQKNHAKPILDAIAQLFRAG